MKTNNIPQAKNSTSDDNTIDNSIEMFNSTISDQQTTSVITPSISDNGTLRYSGNTTVTRHSAPKAATEKIGVINDFSTTNPLLVTSKPDYVTTGTTSLRPKFGNSGFLVGVCVGPLIILLIIFAVAFYCFKKRTRTKKLDKGKGRKQEQYTSVLLNDITH